MTSDDSIVEAEHLHCGYGPREVLRDLSLAVRPGELLILAGANGSGKTTLLRALARLLRPQRGTIRFAGRDIWNIEANEVSRRTAVAPQSERRDWPLTVTQAVQMGRSPHRGWFLPFTAADQAAVALAIERAGLANLAERPITELSGGEWRRMILARALAQQAEVLLLDEPTAGLDLKYQVEMLELVRCLAHHERLAVVVTLHDLNQASFFADRIALLSDRSLLAVGSAENVLTAERIEEAYGLKVTVCRHPIYGTPFVAPHLAAPQEMGGERGLG